MLHHPCGGRGLLYASADELALDYFRRCQGYAVLPAHDLRVMRAVVCGHCGQGPKTTIVTKRSESDNRIERTREICSTCRQNWNDERSEDCDILRSEVKIYPRMGQSEETMAVLLDPLMPLCNVIEPRPVKTKLERWVSYIRVWLAYLMPEDGQGATFKSVASKGIPGIRNERAARWAIQEIRRVVTKRGVRAGLLVDVR